MSFTFTKLFSSITLSTIWSEPDETRLVWITMLAMSDRRGRVLGSIPGLAHAARVSLPGAIAALEALMAPDKFSRTKEHDGRRVIEIEGGWLLLNYTKYREIQDDETIKESKRRYIQQKREQEKAKNVDKSIYSRSPSIQAEAEAEADTKTIQKKGPTVLKKSPERPEDVCTEAWDGWVQHRKAKKAAITDRVISSMRKAASDAGMTLEQAMDWSVQQNHQGFYPPKPGQNQSGETAYQRSMRLKMEQVCPAVAAKPPGYRPEVKRGDVIDMISQIDFKTDLLKRG